MRKNGPRQPRRANGWAPSCWTPILSVFINADMQGSSQRSPGIPCMDLLAVCSVTLEEQISGWSTLARTALTPQDQEHAAMFLTALVVSRNKFAFVPLTVSAATRVEQ